MLGSAGAPVIAVTDNISPAHANQIGTCGQKQLRPPGTTCFRIIPTKNGCDIGR